MSTLEEAKAADGADDPIRAAALYEEALVAGEAAREEYIDLAVLYFVCCDGGYAAAHHLDREFLDKAWRRARQLLGEAQLKFGRDDEIEFWRGYFDFIVLGEPSQEEKWRALATRGASRVPLIYALPALGEKFREDARQLLESVQKGATARERYIKSVIESALRRHERSNRP